MKKPLLICSLLLGLSIPLMGCNQEEKIVEKEKISASSITFKGTGYNEGQPLKIVRGSSVTIVATVYPKNATNRKVTWSCKSTKIEIQDLGDNKVKITGWSVCESNVVATCGEYSQNLPIKVVTEIMPESIQCPTETFELKDNTRQEVNVCILPLDATNNDFNVTIEPVTTEVPNNTNGITYIKEEDTFYLKELEADIDDIYKVTITSSRTPSLKKSFNVKVIPYDVESVKFRKENVVLSLNDPTFRMTPKFEPEQTTYLKVTFDSLNKDICDIDANTGKLLPKKTGVATVRAISEMDPNIYAETTVTVTNEATDYLFRGMTKAMVDELPVSTKDYQDMEFDKVAFAEWKSAYSEDTWYSHALDGGWSKWICGEDYSNDNNEPADDRMNTLVYNKMVVPATATIVQFVFRSHLHPTDTSNVRIMLIDDQYNVTDLTNGWIRFNQTYDQFINFDVTAYQGKNVTFVIEQDATDDIFVEDEDVCCHGKFLCFRRMGFNVNNNILTEEEFYQIKDITNA